MARDLITIENARLVLKNFSGRSDKYTPEGKRSFGVVISPELAEQFENEGILVKYFAPRHEEDEPLPWVKVKVNLNRENPPKIFTARGDERTRLTEDSVKILDFADIINASMQLSIYDWNFAGKTGKALYLQNLVAFLDEDDFLSKYDLVDVD